MPRFAIRAAVHDDQIRALKALHNGAPAIFSHRICQRADQSGTFSRMNNDDRAPGWRRVCEAICPIISQTTPEARIAALVDAIWIEFGNHRPVSWVGYYHLGDGEMTLGYRRDKPACSPIGLHGACGQAALSGRSLIVPDVRALGEGYIACDPRDLSELVVPMRDSCGRVIGVIDLDSYSVGAFGPADQARLEELVDMLRSGS